MVKGITLRGVRSKLVIAAAAAGLIISFSGSAHAATGYDLTPTTGTSEGPGRTAASGRARTVVGISMAS